MLPLPLAMAAAFNPEQVRLCYRDVAAEAARERCSLVIFSYA